MPENMCERIMISFGFISDWKETLSNAKSIAHANIELLTFSLHKMDGYYLYVYEKPS